MTLALVAQTVIHQLRTRLGEPYNTWDANHLAHDLFFALEGDVRVNHDTIIVTYYNAPNADRLRRITKHYPNDSSATASRREYRGSSTTNWTFASDDRVKVK